MNPSRKGITAGRKRVTFACRMPHAAEVALAGDFNQWNTDTHPMKRDPDGVWKRVVMLHPGSYEYKFLVDGEWIEDPKNILYVMNSFGSRNSVVTVY